MNVELSGPVLNLHSRQIQFRADKTEARTVNGGGRSIFPLTTTLSVIVPVTLDT